jgi:1,2-diacylglycerol 3-alpha-glucosyltransferase
MHIAFFTDTYAPQVNGVAKVVETLADGFAKRGHEVTICTVSSREDSVTLPGKLKKTNKPRIIRYASATLPTYKELRVTIPTVLGSLWWLEQSRPDVIHVHTPFGMGWEAVAISKMYGIPLVGTLHTFLVEYARHHVPLSQAFTPITNRIEPTFYNRCKLITSPSRALAGELTQRKIKRPIIILQNPTDIEQFAVNPAMRAAARKKYGLGEQDRALLYLGRLSTEKNLSALLRIVAPVLAKTGRKLILVGDGPARADLEKEAEQLGSKGSVVFTGVLHGADRIDAFAAADLFVTASLTENQPMTIIEAKAAGLPTVAFAARGIPEMIIDGENGLLIKEDDAAGLTEAIEKVVSDDALRAKMSASALKSAQGYGLDRTLSRLEEIYKGLLKE